MCLFLSISNDLSILLFIFLGLRIQHFFFLFVVFGTSFFVCLSTSKVICLHLYLLVLVSTQLYVLVYLLIVDFEVCLVLRPYVLVFVCLDRLS